MRSLKQSGFGLVGIFLMIILLGLLGGGGYVVYARIQDNKKTENHPDKTSGAMGKVSALDATNALKAKIEALPHRGNKAPNLTGDFFITYEAKDPEMQLELPATFGFTFNASIYATNRDIAPVGSQGPNGSGVNEALHRDKVDAIFTAAGLSKTNTTGNEPHVRIFYENKDVLCNIRDSIGVASVTCVDMPSVDAASKSVKDATEVLKAKFIGIELDKTRTVRFSTSSDGTVKGIKFESLPEQAGGIYDAYLSDSGSGWQYIGSDEQNRSGPIPPACDVIASIDLKDVFRFYYGATCK